MALFHTGMVVDLGDVPEELRRQFCGSQKRKPGRVVIERVIPAPEIGQGGQDAIQPYTAKKPPWQIPIVPYNTGS